MWNAINVCILYTMILWPTYIYLPNFKPTKPQDKASLLLLFPLSMYALIFPPKIKKYYNISHLLLL